MNRLAVINVVGLTTALLGRHMPRLTAWRERGALAHIAPAFPAVTCTAQATYLTGQTPARHGIVGNGWYDRELAEVQFWKQSNHLVQAPKIWEHLRERLAVGSARPTRFTAANCFWWYNMYSTVDYALTPRPIYRADGGKIFDIYTWPYGLRPEIKKELGEFPFFGFWGPAAGVRTSRGGADSTSRWIAEAAKWIEAKHSPSLNLVYLPHLDYNLQRHGPFIAGPEPTDAPAGAGAGGQAGRVINPAIIPDLRAVDELAGALIDYFEHRKVRVAVLSEYGLTTVDTPVHLNRSFRERGWLAIKDELGREILDAGASRVFAVADHQVAHIYLNDPTLEPAVRDLLEKTTGVERILGKTEKVAAGIDHARAGELVAVARENAWFSYYYWQEDAKAPDFARTVDIHRKPGYDPVELFVDPKIAAPKLKIAWRLLQKQLGWRMLMDVIPLEAGLVKGSHGRIPAATEDWPVLITGQPDMRMPERLPATGVFELLQQWAEGMPEGGRA
jgi:predicted AlkP superfamily pyrophosphatase or phosphodiesterase